MAVPGRNFECCNCAFASSSVQSKMRVRQNAFAPDRCSLHTLMSLVGARLALLCVFLLLSGRLHGTYRAKSSEILEIAPCSSINFLLFSIQVISSTLTNSQPSRGHRQILC